MNMSFIEFLTEYEIYETSDEYECEDVMCEEIFTDEDDNILDEGAIRQFKKVGKSLKRQFRCTSGPKEGKIAATPQACATRKDPKKVRHGRKVLRTKKGIIVRKTAISKRKAISRLVAKMNKRLSGKT